MSVRLYVPATLPALAEAVSAGHLVIPADAVRAVDESEDAEYSALLDAADLSAALVEGLPDGARRRVVAVVEAGDGAAIATLAELVAIHVDDSDDADPDDDLSWYATQELGDLLA